MMKYGLLIAALVIALTAQMASPDVLKYLARLVALFQDMLPILAVGALVKYIYCGPNCK